RAGEAVMTNTAAPKVKVDAPDGLATLQTRNSSAAYPKYRMILRPPGMRVRIDTTAPAERPWSIFFVLCIVLGRLALAAGQPLQAIGGADHDDGMFTTLARHLLQGAWLGPYDSLTLVKGPGYPIFIAANFWLGLPLYLTQTLFYIASCAALTLAVRPFLPARWAAVLLFGILAFCPSSFE